MACRERCVECVILGGAEVGGLFAGICIGCVGFSLHGVSLRRRRRDPVQVSVVDVAAVE